MHSSIRDIARIGAVTISLVFATGLPAVAIAQEPRSAETEESHDAAHTAEAGDAAGPNPLAVDPDLAIWTFVVFLLLFFILSYFAWPQIAAAVDERERRIAESIKAALEKHEEAKRVLTEHEARLTAAAGEVRELLEEARRDAEHTRKRIEAAGHQAAQEELARAIREIQRAKEGAIHELAVTTADTAIELARKVVREKLTPEQQNQLVREALGKLTTMAPSNN